MRVLACLLASLAWDCVDGSAASAADRDPESLWYMGGQFFVPDSDVKPRRAPHPPAQARLPRPVNIVEHTIEGPDGDVVVTETLSEFNRPLIFYCGGAGFSSTYDGAFVLERLFPLGDVLFYDYPGHGLSGGKGSRKEYVPSAKLALKFAMQRARQLNRQLILWGTSLGGLVCPFAVPATGPPDLIVLESPSVRNSSINYPRQTPHPQLAALTGYPFKLLILAATRDPVPESAYVKLAELFREQGTDAETLIFETSHANILFANDAYARLAPHVAAMMRRRENAENIETGN
jgi:pimeloyl-ACP methyl ester carboxylesterase